jgi:hypothetical protein
MSTKDNEMLKDHVLSIVKTLENGYYSKDNLEVRQDDSLEGGQFYIANIENDNILDDEFFNTEDEAQAYLNESPGEMLSGYDYLSDVLDIEYIVNSKKEYLGARILVAFGGPNIWINTRTQQVEGYWWGSSSIWSYSEDAMDIDSALEDLYNC